MANQYHVRPSALLAISDPYAAYCFDEAVYLFGTHVEFELHQVSAKAKTNEEAAASRRNMLAHLLFDPPESEGGEGAGGGNGYVHDPTDPVSEETARRMPAPVRFNTQKFLDPADTFKRAASRKQETT